jgi:uncharacterized protein (TIGR00251 family)
VIDVKDHLEGCVLPVRAQPGAKRAGLVGEQAGALKVAVTAAPEQGKANKALIEVLSKALGVKKSQIELLNGAASRDKRFLIRGAAAAQVLAAIEEKLSK